MPAFLRFAVALCLVAPSPATGDAPPGPGLRLEGASATAGGGALRGVSGTSLYGAFLAPSSPAVLRGPSTGRVLQAGFFPVAFRPFTDTDGDGYADAADRCILAADPDQRDSDGDGYGDACDADFDGDGQVDFRDLARLRGAFFGSDPRFDLDGDGAVSFGDLARLRAAMFRPPGPSGLRP